MILYKCDNCKKNIPNEDEAVSAGFNAGVLDVFGQMREHKLSLARRGRGCFKFWKSSACGSGMHTFDTDMMLLQIV